MFQADKQFFQFRRDLDQAGKYDNKCPRLFPQIDLLS